MDDFCGEASSQIATKFFRAIYRLTSELQAQAKYDPGLALPLSTHNYACPDLNSRDKQLYNDYDASGKNIWN